MPKPTDIGLDLLDALVRPRAIAVLGASSDPEKLNGRIVRFLKDKGYKGAIYPVNPKATEILGLRCYPTLEAIGAPVDLVVVGVAAAQTPSAIRDAAKAGAKAALVFASGFAEQGPEGRALQEALVAAARESGIRICGPNSVGVVNAFDDTVATFSQVGNNPVNPGPFAFVTQSGAIGTVMNTLANRRGLGVGYLVHTGNEADITAVDAIAAVAADDRVKVVGAYLEGVRDGEALCRVAQHLVEKGKPLVVIKVGRSVAGARAVASHTGALATEDRLFDDLSRQFGILRARNEAHLLDVVDALEKCPVAGEGGLGLITQSGGTAVMMADRAEELGLPVPELQSSTVEALRKVLPPYASFANPVDASMQAVADPGLLCAGLVEILRDSRVAVAVAWLQHMDAKADLLVELFSELKQSQSKPFIVAWSAAPLAAVSELQRRGVCVASSADVAVDMAHALMTFGRACRSSAKVEALDFNGSSSVRHSGIVPTLDAQQALMRSGVKICEARLARSAEEAVQVAEELESAVALKIESPDLPHKTDVGGVRLGLRTRHEVASAYNELIATVNERAPRARLSGVLVQRMADSGLELVVGLRNDITFGMTLMLGIGGVFVEAYRDVTFRKLPVDRATAKAMVSSLKGQALLALFRGRPAIDFDALTDMLCAVSDFGMASRTWLQELDLNPVIARHDGVIAVDWLVVGQVHDALTNGGNG